jgi:hypothetical protein
MDANKGRTFVSIRGCFSSPLVAALPRCDLLRSFVTIDFSRGPIVHFDKPLASFMLLL